MLGAAIVAPLLAKQGVKSTFKIAKIAIPILILLALGIYIYSLKSNLRSTTKERDNLKTWQTSTVNVVIAEVPVNRRASVTSSTAADEIRWLGREYRTHRDALERQSKALMAAKGDAVAAVNEATIARKRAKEANSAREAIRAGLNTPGRTTGLSPAEWEKL